MQECVKNIILPQPAIVTQDSFHLLSGVMEDLNKFFLLTVFKWDPQLNCLRIREGSSDCTPKRSFVLFNLCYQATLARGAKSL